jgi:undecaprenyl-diphosphatase
MISLFQAFIYSIVQGITEWLPISSSAHIALLQNIFGFQNLPFIVFLQFASILAVIFIFWKDIIRLFNFKNKENLKYWGFLIVALIPVVIVGYFFEHLRIQLSTFFYIGIFFMISGIIVYSTKFMHHKEGKKLNLFDSIFIGVVQVISLFPGISRSGSTISAGMFRGIKREDAVKFSFLLAIPTILGASLLELKNLVSLNVSYGLLITTFIVTFLVSILAIKVLLKIVRSDKFYLFGIYDFILGLIVFLYSLIVHS